MKKLLSLIFAFLILTSCADAEQMGKELSEKYKTKADITFEAEITAEFPDRCDKYRVRYNYRRGRQAAVTLLYPESIAGIEAVISEDGTSLKFKDIILETGVINSPSPVNVLHKLLLTWEAAEISQIGKSDDNILLVLDDGECEYRTTFSPDYTPISAEVINNSKLQMKIDFIKCEGITNDN